MLQLFTDTIQIVNSQHKTTGRVRTGAKDKNGLKRGVYIINGKKCVVK